MANTASMVLISMVLISKKLGVTSCLFCDSTLFLYGVPRVANER